MHCFPASNEKTAAAEESRPGWPYAQPRYEILCRLWRLEANIDLPLPMDNQESAVS